MDNEKTLRLIFPQWQGGDNPSYSFGSHLLNWLAPVATGPVEEVAVSKPDGAPLKVTDGVLAREEVIHQMRDARDRIERHSPDRIVVFGGDCGVDLVPFAYLNERYDGELAVLWIDAHSDTFSGAVFPNSHAHVLGTLLGQGDEQFLSHVARPIKPGNALIAGWQKLPDSLPALQNFENEIADRMKIQRIGSQDLAHNSEAVLAWLRQTGAKHLAIHLDLDVLDPNLFRALTFTKPGSPSATKDDIQAGTMTIGTVVRLVSDVAQQVDVVGFGITEYMPWDAIALQEALTKFPLIGSRPNQK